MTLPYERKRSVSQTERFLLDLCNPKLTPKVPGTIREQARSLLRHYPSSYHMEIVCEAVPDIFSEQW
jgi:hypothetical protein